jgi:hypothetical protein
VLLSNAREVRLAGNDVWGNTVGVLLTGPNASIELDGNRVTGNVAAGVEIASPGSNATLTGNTIDANDQGILVGDGSLEARDNRIEGNADGIDIRDRSPAVTIVSNDIVGNHRSGIRFAEPEGIVLEGNTLADNRDAPFLVVTVGDAESYVEANRVEPGTSGIEATYIAIDDTAGLATITPVPSYFFTPPEQAFNQLQEEDR